MWKVQNRGLRLLFNWPYGSSSHIFPILHANYRWHALVNRGSSLLVAIVISSNDRRSGSPWPKGCHVFLPNFSRGGGELEDAVNVALLHTCKISWDSTTFNFKLMSRQVSGSPTKNLVETSTMCTPANLLGKRGLLVNKRHANFCAGQQKKVGCLLLLPMLLCSKAQWFHKRIIVWVTFLIKISMQSKSFCSAYCYSNTKMT